MAELSWRGEGEDGDEEEGGNPRRGGSNRAIVLADNVTNHDPFHNRFDLSHLPHDAWKDNISCWCLQLYPTCIWSIFCPCILAGQVSETIQWRKSSSIIFYFCLGVLAIGLFTYFSKSIGLLLFISVILFTLAFQLRSNLRRFLRLPGDACSDCCLSFCCPWCVIAQVSPIATFLLNSNFRLRDTYLDFGLLVIVFLSECLSLLHHFRLPRLTSHQLRFVPSK
jgi:Cys-rich protein (TIGR01571 family)